jgi:hypothetical protein
MESVELVYGLRTLISPSFRLRIFIQLNVEVLTLASHHSHLSDPCVL